MLGDNRRTAVEASVLHRAQRHQRRFAGQLRPITHHVGVDDGLADDNHALSPKRIDELIDGVAVDFLLGDELSQPTVGWIDCLLHRIDQGSRTEHDIAGGEHDPAAIALDDMLLRLKPRIAVVFILSPLDINVRANDVEQVGCGRLGVDHNPIDAVEGSEALGAKLLWDKRPARSFVHHRVAADCHQQPITQLGGVLKVPNVAGVDDVEAAVTECDRFAPTLRRANGSLGLGEAENLVLSAHAV